MGLIKVMLLDDHPLVMEGLKKRLEEEDDIIVTAALTEPEKLWAEMVKEPPDVVILDVSMPGMNGFELAERMKSSFGLAIKIVMLSGYTYDEFYKKAYRLGVHAYLSKQSGYPEIINAIRQSMMGHALVSERVLRGLGTEALTPTERSILKALSLEKTNKEIANDMAMSLRTVEAHIASLTQKLGVRTRIGAVARGYEWGLLSPLSE